MTIKFPHKDSITGELVEVDYWTLAEVAPMLHTAPATVRAKCRAREWPHLEVGGRFYFNANQIAAIVDLHTVHHDDPEPPLPLRLGVAVDDDDLPGGVR